MTATVGSAAPSGKEALLQTASGRTSNVQRGHVKNDDERNSQLEEPTQRSPRREIETSDTHVDKAEKISRRQHGKEKSNQDDGSFEDTFDSIGQDQNKDAASKSVKTPSLPSDLLIPQVAGKNTDQTNSGTPQVPPETQQRPVRPAAQLQQKSILALLDAKDRLSTTGDAPKAESVTPSDNAEQVGFSTDTTEVVPMTLNRRETHWNFNSNAMTSAASQLSALQLGDRNLPPAALIQGATSAATLKESAPDAKSSSLASPPASPQSVAMPDSDQMPNTFFNNSSGDNQTGTQSQGQPAVMAPAVRKAVQTDPSSTLEQIFTTNATPQPSAPSVTNQVRDGVIDTLSASTIDPSAGTSTVDVAARPATAPVLRTLDLTLSPPDLGSVRLRLSLQSNSLSIDAETSKASTAKLLNDDRQNLERGLKDAGYDVSNMKITDTSASNAANSNGWQANGAPQRDADQSRSSFMGRQDGDMPRRDGSPSDQAQRRPKEHNPQAAPAEVAAGRLGNAVYI